MELLETIINKTLTPDEKRAYAERARGERFIYLCLPFEGNLKAYEAKAAVYSRLIEKDDTRVLFPYLLYRRLPGRDPEMKSHFIYDCIELVIRDCDEFWIVRDVFTPNMLAELELAVQKGKKTRFFDRNGKEDDPDE